MASEAARDAFLAATREVDAFYEDYRQRVRDLISNGAASDVGDLGEACRSEGRLVLAYLIEHEAHAYTSEMLRTKAEKRPAKRAPRSTRNKDDEADV